MACGFSSLAMTQVSAPSAATRSSHGEHPPPCAQTKPQSRRRHCLMRELQVLFVLLRQRRHAHRDAGQIDALVLAQHAAVDDFAFHIVAVHIAARAARSARRRAECARRAPDFPPASGRSSRSASTCPAMSRGVMVSRWPVLSCTGIGFSAGRCGSSAPADRPECRSACSSSRETLRTISISLSFSGVGAVGKVQPGHIEPGAEQFAENIFSRTGRAQGGHYFGPAPRLRGRGFVRFHQGKTHWVPRTR